MARSIWKGPFVDGYLLKKAEPSRGSGRSEVIKIWSRRSTILPQFVGLTFGVYNGHKHIPVQRHRGHDRPQVRRVLADADLPRPRGRQEGEEGLIMSQGEDPARAQGQRGQGGLRACCASARRSSILLAQLIRGKKVDRALADLNFSRKRIAARRQEDAGERDRQCRKQSQPRRRRSRRRRGLRRQGAGDEALHARARGRAGRIEKPFSNLTIVVREVEAAAAQA